MIAATWKPPALTKRSDQSDWVSHAELDLLNEKYVSMLRRTSDPQRSIPALASFRRSARSVFLALAIVSLGVNLLMLTGPLYMLQVYDRVLSSGSTPTLVALTALVAGLFAGLALLDGLRTALFARIAARFERILGPDVFRALRLRAAADPSARNDRELRDLAQFRQFLSSPALTAAYDAPFAPFYLLLLFAMHWLLGAVATIASLALVVLAIVNQAWNAKTLRDSMEAQNAANMLANEVNRNAEAVEVLGMGGDLSKRWSTLNGRASAATMASAGRLGGFAAAIKAFRLFMQSAILGAGAYLAIRGEASPGVMIAASILMGRAVAPVEQGVGQWRAIVGAREAYRRIKKTLKAAPPVIEAMPLPAIAGHLSLERVYAGSPSANVPVLKDVSFNLTPGEALGVIGPSAAGKSTLARVLTGLWAPSSGAVRLDGAELAHWDSAQLGTQIGFLPQDVELLSGTVVENISRFAPDPNPEDVVAAARAAGAHDMILRLADGYDTHIGVGGGYLSAGQKQRVGLARALFGGPAFVVLDEPNSNLDSAGDAALSQALEVLKARGATVVVIAHRPSAVSKVDKLLVLDDGFVRMLGPRDEVLAKVLRSGETSSVVSMSSRS
ncbi:MAG: type I secretion system permease/ATPase [Pseudomonadota bacterium]